MGNAFEEEFLWLENNLPEALASSEFSFNQFQTLTGLIQEFSEEPKEIRLFDNIRETERDYNNSATFSSLDGLISEMIELYENFGGTIPDSLLANLTTEIGHEAFGMYLPMHYFYNSRKNPWGIYLFPELIIAQADKLYNEIGKSIGLTKEQVRYAYGYAVYRHEMFHHQVERFATKLEIWNREVVYVKYQQKVNRRTRYSEEWLEEALAEDSVLSSVHVINKAKIDGKKFKELYKYDLKSMPPGYRDYHCRIYDGPSNARRLFASQIALAEKDIPFKKYATTIGTVNNNENSLTFGNVPIYMVRYKHLKRIAAPSEIFGSVASAKIKHQVLN
jgi:hypothetical protein